jgi:hypothetical protein
MSPYSGLRKEADVESLAMSQRVHRRLEVFRRVRERELPMVTTLALLDLSDRQAKRGYGRYRTAIGMAEWCTGCGAAV